MQSQQRETVFRSIIAATQNSVSVGPNPFGLGEVATGCHPNQVEPTVSQPNQATPTGSQPNQEKPRRQHLQGTGTLNSSSNSLLPFILNTTSTSFDLKSKG